MDKSHCYNPFKYLKTDNDLQKLVTNLFKSTTPKGSQSQDPFWDTAASMLLLALVFYLKYEAPPDEQNFPMVMELLRAGEVREDDDSYPDSTGYDQNQIEYENAAPCSCVQREAAKAQGTAGRIQAGMRTMLQQKVFGVYLRR